MLWRIFISLLFFISAFSVFGQGQKRVMVLGEASHSNAFKNELRLQEATVLRHLEFTNGLVLRMSDNAIEQLQRRFPELQFINDKKRQLIQPTAGKNPNKGGGKNQPAPDPAQEIPWGIGQVQAASAHQYSKGAGQTICVIDTGVDKTHNDLAANIIGGRNYVVSKGRVNLSDWNDDNGHGSHVAGTIAALDNEIGVIGVAPEASIYAVKALDRRGSGSFSDVIDGIYHCVSAGADVINMSLGAQVSHSTDLAQLIQDSINYANAMGVDVVAAAGNSAADISSYVPAGLDNVIAVSSLDEDLSLSYFSNYGLGADDFAAPGRNILSTWKNGEYNSISGTSMAAPHVAGVLALSRSANSLGPVATDIGLSVSAQGAGLIDALLSVLNL